MTGIVNKPTSPTPAALAPARPILKWVGGKAKLLPDLLARLPSSVGRYYEPFAGGAALFFRLAPGRAVIGDANEDLINCYRTVAVAPAAVGMALREHGAAHCESHYLAVKAAWNRRAFVDDVDRAAAFIYMNKVGFNGLFRVNAKGEFNVGWGKRASYEPDLEELAIAGAQLAAAELRAGDFRATVADVALGDFVYIDSPYDETFSSYTAGKCSTVDQAEIAFEVRTLAQRGVRVMVSNADTPRIRALYAGLRMDVVQTARSVNRDGAGRGKVDEVIITAGYAPDDGAIARLAAERAGERKRRRGAHP